MNDPSTSAHFIQDGMTACFAANKKRGCKGGCKGKGKTAYPVRPSNLPIEDRRNTLAEPKAKSECKVCGRKGHWKGDKQCTMTKTGMYAVTGVASVAQSIPSPINRPSSSGLRMMVDMMKKTSLSRTSPCRAVLCRSPFPRLFRRPRPGRLRLRLKSRSRQTGSSQKHELHHQARSRRLRPGSWQERLSLMSR